MGTTTIFETAPTGADTDTTAAGGSSGTGTIDLSLGETEVIGFDMTSQFVSNPPSDAPTFSASETGPGSFDASTSPDGVFTFTITQTDWVAQGSPASIQLLFSNDGANSFLASYTLNITCFARGTAIATPGGESAVETLQIGDLVRTADGRDVPVKWIGRQTLRQWTAGARMQPVRIAAGALGDNQPHADLTVTSDHGMVLDGLVITAGALVNGTSIDWVPMADLPPQITVYHVETEAHDVILANGAPAETFIDHAGRSVFDNHAEYVALYGAERIVPELDMPRIGDRRLLPEALKARLGIDTTVADDADFALAG